MSTIRSLISRSSTLPVSLLLAKKHLRIEESETIENDLITLYINAAVRGLEHATGRALVTTQSRLELPKFKRQIDLPFGPVQSVQSVKYRDLAGNEQTINSSNYKLVKGLYSMVLFNEDYDFPEVSQSITNPVQVEYTSGEPTLRDDLQHSVLVAVGTAYLQRESFAHGSATDVSDFFVNYFEKYRVVRL